MFTIMLLIVTFSIGQMARRRRVPALRLGAFLLLIAFASAGCGLGDSGGSIPATTDTGTPSGIYPMVVTGTAGTITSTTTVTVNVN
jgi:hypothetical protein